MIQIVMKKLNWSSEEEFIANICRQMVPLRDCISEERLFIGAFVVGYF